MPFKNHKCTFTFEISYKFRHTHFGRYLYKHMYVIWTYLRFYNINFFSLT